MKSKTEKGARNGVAVALLARAWIEIFTRRTRWTIFKVALLARAWIEISIFSFINKKKTVALLARAWIEMM